MNIQEQTVMIVGGGSGIGFGVARACLARGARVVLAGRTLSKLEHALIRLGASDRGRAIAADISEEADVARLLDTPHVDHIVVTAAELAYQSISEFEIAAARRAIESKLIGALLVAKYAAAKLNRNGSLTFTSGVASERPLPRGSIVAAVNGALHSFVRAAALELAPLRVNALSPGWVDSELWDVIGVDKAQAFSTMAQRLPVGRIGLPDDLGHAAVFLMENEFTTGAVLTVDGGHRFT